MIINIIIFSLWVWAFEGNLHLSGWGIVALLFINKKKTKLRLTLLASGNTARSTADEFRVFLRARESWNHWNAIIPFDIKYEFYRNRR